MRLPSPMTGLKTGEKLQVRLTFVFISRRLACAYASLKNRRSTILPCLADREYLFLVFGWYSSAIAVEQRFAANFEASRASARKHLVVRFHPAFPVIFFGNERWLTARRDILFPINSNARFSFPLPFIPPPFSTLSGLTEKCCSAVPSSRSLLLSYLRYMRSRLASLMALRRFEASIWVVGSSCELSTSPPLPPPRDARLFPIYSTCGGIVGFYAHTQLVFLSYRGSFFLVVYTTVILISHSRERPARGFCRTEVCVYFSALQCFISFD